MRLQTFRIWLLHKFQLDAGVLEQSLTKERH